MKIWKLIALVLLAALAVALIYPGIPITMTTENRKSASGQSLFMVCHYLHWNGIRRRETDLGNSDVYSYTSCWFPK